MQIIEGKRYPTVTDDAIKGFFGDFRHLSNFHVCPVKIDGLEFTSSEAAYMSRKFMDGDTKARFVGIPPREARELGTTRPMDYDQTGWNQVRVLYMYRAVKAKFSQNEDLKDLLLSTGDKYLEETNDWGDTFWGVQNGIGENMLGRVLMLVREELRYEKQEARGSQAA